MGLQSETKEIDMTYTKCALALMTAMTLADNLAGFNVERGK